jgi:4-amino-4-deoxy-L-arabinose transferase-like glycosyltransferase
MQSHSKFRQLLLTFFIIGVAVRLIFIFGRDQVPVMWDARLYSSAALGLIHYGLEGGEYGHPEKYAAADTALQKARFKNTMGKYLEGEQIEWLYYTTPTVASAQEYIFLSGPLYPAYLASIFVVNVWPDFPTVRVFNAFIDGFCIVLLMLIADGLFKRKTALIAGGIYIFYFPFILMTGLVSPEPPTILLILLCFYWLLQWYKTEKTKYIYLCGLALGLLVLAKPTASLLFIPFGLGFLYDYRHRLRSAWPLVARAALPFILVTLPWLIVTSLYFGQASIRDPRYSEANFRSSSSIKYEGYDLDIAEKDFWLYPVSYNISQNPAGYAGLLVKKFIRLWSQPFNDFKQSLLLGDKLWRLLHALIILTALFGVFYFLLDDRPGLMILFLIPLYYTLIHIVLHSLARYNLNAMPVMILAASAVISNLWDCAARSWSNIKLYRKILYPVIFAAGIIFLVFVPTRSFIVIFGSSAGVTASIILRILFLLCLIWIIIKFLARKKGIYRPIVFAGIPGIILVILILSAGFSPDSWAEWQCPLRNSYQGAGARIYIPKSFKMQAGDVARIGIDLTGVAGGKNDFYITINGRKAPYNLGQPPLDMFYYRKVTYQIYEDMVGIRREEMRHWSFLTITDSDFNELVNRYGFIQVEITPVDSMPVDYRINLYGNYSAEGRDSILVPDLNHSSIERYIEKGDPRIWVKYPLSSDSVISYYSDDIRSKNIRTDDLSPAMGIQKGRYRIVIEIKKLDETRVYF